MDVSSDGYEDVLVVHERSDSQPEHTTPDIHSKQRGMCVGDVKLYWEPVIHHLMSEVDHDRVQPFNTAQSTSQCPI